MVYLDYNASTPVDQRVRSAVDEAFEVFGNPSSTHHALGQAAHRLVEGARTHVAALFGRPEQDVIFTSGATEAAALGILGAMIGRGEARPHIVASATEHKAVLSAASLAARLTGGQTRRAPVDRRGLVDMEALQDLIDDSVGVVAVMAANNETGVVSPLEEVADVARRHGALLFVDATQLVGKAPIPDVVRAADLIVFSSHKIYGPKGAGALVASRHVQKELVPIVSGGGQERGLRGGTHNTPAILGFGLAAELAFKEQAADAARIEVLANRLLGRLCRDLPDVVVNGGDAVRLTNTMNVRFVGADAEAVMASMPGVQVSTGSACQSAVPTPSHVLTAMGLDSAEASECIRISLGRPTTSEEIDTAADAIIAAVKRVRELTNS